MLRTKVSVTDFGVKPDVKKYRQKGFKKQLIIVLLPTAEKLSFRQVNILYECDPT